MKKNFILATACMLLFACNTEKKKEDQKMDDGNKPAMTSTDKKPATELLDLSQGDPMKKSVAAFSNRDINGMTADYDDNVRYTWSGGDSLIGKKAVIDYYNGRLKLIKSINFSNEIVLPMQINESQQPQAAPPGKWVLFWAFTDVTYNNGKNIKFWQHTVNHFNAANKVDFVGMYLDRHPIMEATKDIMPK